MSSWPIARRLTAMLVLVSGVVLLLASAAFAGYELWSFRRSARQAIAVRAQIIAMNSTAALAFDDDAAARETLGGLRADPNVVVAALYDRDGTLFASYPDGVDRALLPPTPAGEGYRFEDGLLVGYEPVAESDARLGTFYIASSLGGLYETLALAALIGLTVFLLSLLAAWGLSLVLQRTISRPILGLAQTAKAVTSSQDLSVRAPDVGGGELGDLAHALNQMLERIDEQNRLLRAGKEELERHAEELEQRVAERTHELEEMNDELRRNAAGLETANRELDAFAYSVSHDLRAPLRSIDGFSAVLLEDYRNALDEAGQGYLGRVRAASQRMGELIDAMLKLSRITRIEMRPESVDLSAMAEEIAEELTATDPERRVDFEIAPGLEVLGDRRLLQVVLENLLGNSWKYTAQKPEPRIEFGAQKVNGYRAYVVRDNGAGFDMKYADKLFGEFQRLHAQDEFQGTGVGLATVRRIITRHGGDIWAEGAVDKGAAFYFTL